MATSTETGHNKNAANFSNAFLILEEMGALYNPSNNDISLATLSPIRGTIANIMNNLNDKKPVYKNAVAAREIKIEPLSRLITKTNNYAKSLKISTSDKENIQTQVKKLRGDTKNTPINPDTIEANKISTTQMSYDSRIANFDTYINQLQSHTEYAPNETELSLNELQNYYEELKTLSNEVNTAGYALITARKERNDVLYNNDNNIIQLMRDVKSYLKSLGKPAEPYYKALVRLKFTDKR